MATVLTTTQVTVGTAATLILASVGTRVKARVKPLTQGVLFVGPAGVTPATGYPCCGTQPQFQAEATLDGLTGDIYGVVAAGVGSMEVAAMEIS